MGVLEHDVNILYCADQCKSSPEPHYFIQFKSQLTVLGKGQANLPFTIDSS